MNKRKLVFFSLVGPTCWPMPPTATWARARRCGPLGSRCPLSATHLSGAFSPIHRHRAGRPCACTSPPRIQPAQHPTSQYGARLLPPLCCLPVPTFWRLLGHSRIGLAPALPPTHAFHWPLSWCLATPLGRGASRQGHRLDRAVLPDFLTHSWWCKSMLGRCAMSP
jgi:hypothetical protein